VNNATLNIVVTGAGKGIGLALVKRFLENQHHCVWAFSRDIQALEKLESPQLHVSKLDLLSTSREELESISQGLFKSVDVLVHNAGVLINKPFDGTSLEDWRVVFETNLFSAVKVNQALLPLLKASQKAHIVHLGSMGGVQGSSKFPGLSAYSASKAALGNLTECMAEELKNDGIHVNCLALGAVDTEMLRQAFPSYKAQISSTEMAEFICDFCLNSRNLFNGKTLQVASSTP
jgi:NAD(P)-dependent dehydrogenase (short-subunit alcohol dehydrogenase family)